MQELPAAACGFSYRSSRFKRTPGRWVVLDVAFDLPRAARSRPVRYAELARALGLAEGQTAPLADVRGAVLALRRGKGMVIDPADPDSVSAGSFFTNPVLDPGGVRRARGAGAGAARRGRAGAALPAGRRDASRRRRRG